MIEPVKLREKLAELEHKQWSHWTDYLLCNLNLKNMLRWAKQVETPYKDLSEEEKESDRKWANKVMEIISRHNHQEIFGKDAEDNKGVQDG